MIVNNTYIIYDFETGSRNPYKTQPIELAAVAVNPRTFEIIENSEFCSLIRPLSDEQALAHDIDLLEDDALKINHKTKEELAQAPEMKIVWKQWVKYVGNYNKTGKKWDAPIMVGFNNNGFDDIIIDRICSKDPWNLGPVSDRGTQGLFHPAFNIDLMRLLMPWFESNYDLKTLSMDNLRELLGISKEGAHEALQDVRDEAAIFCRFMKMTRNFSQRVTFKDSFKIRA